jgi:hypothetical protein
MTHTELAWEFADLFANLEVDEINQLLAKNVHMEMLEFFGSYGESFGRSEGISGNGLQRLPNLMLLGYLLRVLEERLLSDTDDSEH